MDTVQVIGKDTAGVWSVQFADPAIVAIYGIHGNSRATVRYEAVLRAGGRSRRARIE